MIRGCKCMQGLMYIVLELMETDLLRAIADEQIANEDLLAASRRWGWYGR